VAGLSDDAVQCAARLFSRTRADDNQGFNGRGRTDKALHERMALYTVRGNDQFYMIAIITGSIMTALRKADWWRSTEGTTLPSAGFAAGPCLLKDTMQLVSFYGNNFHLGHAAWQ